MTTYVVFLRGINVGGHRKIKMADLKERLIKSGFDTIRTYIQSGNIVLDSEMETKEVVSVIEESIQNDFGYDVPALVLTPKAIENILEDLPYQTVLETKNLYFVLLYHPPKKENYDRLQTNDYSNEEFVITEKCVYLNCKQGASKSKLNNTVIEQKLKVTATTRNLRTLQKMVVLAQSQG